MKPADLAILFERVSGSIDYKDEYERLERELESKGKDSTAAYQKRKEYNAEVKQYKDQTREVDEYNKKVEERDELQTNLILWKLFHIEKDIGEKKDGVKEFDEQIHENMNELAESENILADAKSNYASAHDQFRKLDKKYNQYVKKIDSRQKDVLPLNEKINLMREQARKTQKRLDEVDKDRERQEAEVESVNKGFKVLEKSKKKFEEESRERISALTGLREVSDDILKEYEELNSNYKLQTGSEQSSLEGLLRKKRTDLDKLTALKSKSSETNARIGTLKEEIEGLKRSINETSSSISEDNDVLESTKVELEKIASEKSNRQKKISDLNSQLSAVLRQLLEQNTNKRESEKVLKLKEDTENLRRLFPGVKGLINELLEPKEKRFQTAVSTVLGRNFDSIIVDTQKTARECIDYLKEQRKGSYSFIPLDSIQVSPIPNTMRTLGRNVRLAIDTVNYKQEIERAVQFVCDRTLICDNIEIAKEMKWSRNVSAMMVTLDGGIIHKSNMISGGVSDNRNAQRWEQKDIRGMEVLQTKLQTELSQLTNKRNEYSVNEERLVTSISSLEMKLNDSRTRLNGLQISLESRQAELKNCIQSSKAMAPDIIDLTEVLKGFDAEIGKIEAKVSKVKQKAFANFCSRVNISDIRQFEDAQSSRLEETEKKRLEFSNQLARLQTNLNFETSRLKQTEKRINNMNAELDRNKDIISQLKAERKVINDELSQLETDKNSIQEKVEEAKTTMEGRKSTADDYAKQVHELRNKLTRLQKKQNLLEEDLNRDNSKRLEILSDCKVNGQPIPLSEGSLDSIPIKEIMGEDRDGEEPDGDGDISMDARPSQISDSSAFGITIDYKSLDERLRTSNDSSIENEIEEEIFSLTSQIENMVVNVRANDHLHEAEEKFGDAAKESEEAVKEHRTIRREFEKVKKQRSEAFDNAFNHISKSIDGIYKELTRNKSFPTGGSADLHWENQGEDFAKGIIYSVQPPMKQFGEIEQLSGGEKTMAALALLFAIHRFHPSPFFILDEIDAALDNINIDSISRYIKHNAGENFQFIVISLKNRLFEKSDSLVGIYRDQEINSSKALTLDLRQFDPKRTAV